MLFLGVDAGVSLSGVTEFAGSDMGDVQGINAFDGEVSSTKERVVGKVPFRFWSFFGGSSEVLFLSFSNAPATVSCEFAPKLFSVVGFFFCEDSFLLNCDLFLRLVSLRLGAAEPRSASSS